MFGVRLLPIKTHLLFTSQNKPAPVSQAHTINYSLSNYYPFIKCAQPNYLLCHVSFARPVMKINSYYSYIEMCSDVEELGEEVWTQTNLILGL